MAKLRNIISESGIREFMHKLRSAGITIPQNVEIRVTLTEEQFDKISPFGMLEREDITYHWAEMDVTLVAKTGSHAEN